MEPQTPLGQLDPIEIAEFWQGFLVASGRHLDVRQPDAWPFGDSVELADKLLALVLQGPKRATAGSVAEYETEGEAHPRSATSRSSQTARCDLVLLSSSPMCELDP